MLVEYRRIEHENKRALDKGVKTYPFCTEICVRCTTLNKYAVSSGYCTAFHSIYSIETINYIGKYNTVILNI